MRVWDSGENGTPREKRRAVRSVGWSLVIFGSWDDAWEKGRVDDGDGDGGVSGVTIFWGGMKNSSF